jgi:hypothetical protein
MRKEILHIRNKEYVYVLTNNNGNEKEIDISMFEIEEWADLMSILRINTLSAE